MNKLGLFLAKNTTHILGLYFLGWAIWACLHWASLCLVQKLVMGLFFLLVAHEYEEAYKERFIRVMGQAMGITPEELPVPGLIHVAADTYIAVMFSLALLFPNQMWLVFPVLILGIFEMFVHNWGIVMFRLRGVSPGWYTAMVQGIYSIWALVLINRNVEYDGIQWLWAALLYVGGFAIMEVFTLRSTGKPIQEIAGNGKAFVKNRFGKERVK